MEWGYFFYRVGQDISLALPPRFAYKIASLLADLHYYSSRDERVALFSNLKLITESSNKTKIRKLAKRTFRNFAKNLVDFFRFGLMDSRFFRRNVRIVGLENVDEALRRNKGVLVATGHIGNWELGAIIMAQKGYALNAVTWRHGDPRLNQLFTFQRQRKGVKVIPLGIALRRCFQVLRDNELVAVLGDRDFSEQGTQVRISFFGNDFWVPRGPATLSLRTGATIVPGFTIREKGDLFTLYFEKPIEFNPSGKLEEDIQALTQKILDVIRIYVERFPDQWFMFREFWEQQRLKNNGGRYLKRKAIISSQTNGAPTGKARGTLFYPDS